ncbi:hypothetical protein [Sulfuricella sp.]|uniref:hypothetical protein n=1 Tax=Sulfuricella sp. TaxID=2099377 RepID=UPI002C28EFEB|nr:hypothetical protein [Sulfuricella sp.]HUX63330.1 hypothetical protein [Sulfuricella sp.]
MNLKKAFEPQRRKERKGNGVRRDGQLIAQLAKTMCYGNLLSHRLGECRMGFMSLFSLRLRAFAVNELRFPG